MEQEILLIVEVLKEYRNMLLGIDVTLIIDHKDLLSVNTTSPERVMYWRLLLEEYGVKLKYIKGGHNVVADAFSRLIITKISRARAKKLAEAKVQLEIIIEMSDCKDNQRNEVVVNESRHRVNVTYTRRAINSSKLHDLFRIEIGIVVSSKLRCNALKKRGHKWKRSTPALEQVPLVDFPIYWA